MLDYSRQYEVRVLVNDRTPADEYYHSDSLTYIEGRSGSEYTIELVNNSYERAEFVLSVDGRSVTDGKEAGPNSSGYLLNPHQRMKVPGWKLDGNSAAKFVFTDPRDSYNARGGKGTTNNGVIGAMVFREAVPSTVNFYNSPTMYNGLPSNIDDWRDTLVGSAGPDNTYRRVAQSFNASSTMMGSPLTKSVCSAASAPVPEVGTGFGRETGFSTTEVNFIRRAPTVPDGMVVLYYDSAKGLEKRGIVLKYRGGTNGIPDPFPQYQSITGCSPPPGWPRK